MAREAVAECEACERALEAALGASAADEARDRLSQLLALVEAAQVACEEEDSPHVAREAAAALDVFSREKVGGLKLRVNQLSSAQARQSAINHEESRAQLFSKANDGQTTASRQKIIEQASLLDKSRDINASLRRTMQRVSQELERMTEADKMLTSDARTIASTVEKHGSYKSAAATNEAHLKEIQRQEKIDRLIVFVCFGVFLLVVAYIIWKRTFGWFI